MEEEEEGFLDRATPEAVVARLKADGTFDKHLYPNPPASVDCITTPQPWHLLPAFPPCRIFSSS